MRHTMVTYTVKPGREEENAALVRAVFEELAQTRPAGFRYAVFHTDSRQFVHLFIDDGSTSGLQEPASFQAFTVGAQDRHEQPAAFTQLELIGDYRTFDDDPDRSASAGGPAPATVSTVGEAMAPRPTSEPGCERDCGADRAHRRARGRRAAHRRAGGEEPALVLMHGVPGGSPHL